MLQDGELRRGVIDALFAWKQDPLNSDKFKGLGTSIQSALGKGVDLVIKVPASVLYDTSPNSQAILPEDARSFGGYSGGDHLFFIIPSKLSKETDPNKRLAVTMGNDNGNPVLQISNEAVGIFGTFFPSEVTVEPK